MDAILSSVGKVFTAAIGWVGDVASMITAHTDGVPDNPILLLFGTLSLVGIGVGLYKRLISIN